MWEIFPPVVLTWEGPLSNIAGIGVMITVAGSTFQTDKVFVGVLIFAITGVVLTEIVDRAEHRFDKWRPKVGAGA
jgi:ABC-type nitrate/sulfonate/bicarbonate transport system permease component